MHNYERVPSGPWSKPSKATTWNKKSAYSWSIFVICATCALVAFYELSQALSYEAKEHIPTAHQHPIQQLKQKSQDAWVSMIRTQSNDVPAAAHEYQRRYGRDPPPGFAKWFNYAAAHGSLVMDEFDQINEMIEPFWNVSPEELRRSIKAVSADDTERLGYIKLENGKVTSHNTGHIHNGLVDLIKEVKSDIPDFEMMISGVDEPLVLRSLPGSNIYPSGLVPHKLRSEVSWADMQAPCSFPTAKQHGAPVWTNVSSFVPEEHLRGLPFVQNKYDALDICKHPEFDTMHDFGRTKRLKTRFIYDGLAPIFSQAAFSTSSDIVFPSPQYWESRQARKHDPIPWEKKQNALFWKGKTSGGWALEDSPYHNFIRHRFVALIKGLANPIYTFLVQSRVGFWTTQTSYTALPPSRYTVDFTDLVQCYPDAVCQQEKEYFHIPDKSPSADILAEAENHRLIMDIDNNAFSTHFYRLLATNSAVLKLTAYREWHDERLFPWVHYIPVSLSMEELPETVRWLTETPTGQDIAREIAEQGQEWGSRMLRKADGQVYAYRLLLEWARVLREDRETAGFDVEAWMKEHA